MARRNYSSTAGQFTASNGVLVDAGGRTGRMGNKAWSTSGPICMIGGGYANIHQKMQIVLAMNEWLLNKEKGKKK